MFKYRVTKSLGDMKNSPFFSMLAYCLKKENIFYSQMYIIRSIREKSWKYSMDIIPDMTIYYYKDNYFPSLQVKAKDIEFVVLSLYQRFSAWLSSLQTPKSPVGHLRYNTCLSWLNFSSSEQPVFTFPPQRAEVETGIYLRQARGCS